MPSSPPSSTPSRPLSVRSRRQLSIRLNQHNTLNNESAAADGPKPVGHLRITIGTARRNQEQQQQLKLQLYQPDVCSIAPLNGGIADLHLKFYNKFLLVLFLCISFLLVVGNCVPIVSAWGTNPRVPYRPPKSEPGECRSIDIRNYCDNLDQLHNCTMIRGFLMIVLMPSPRFEGQDFCDYKNYSFPLLREITDFLVIHSVDGLYSIRDLFPNLTVIRGRRLFLNYALSISRMAHLETLEFKSLIAIQRGHVFINNCPKLCNLDKINWNRLTLSVGENHIYPLDPESCPTKTDCRGCATEYCWSNDVCQRFENDNLIDAKQSIQHCDSECLGGCYNSSSDGCLLCRNLEDHGSCVKECPAGKYLFDIFQTCYTKTECTEKFKMTIQGDKCTLLCPEGSVYAVSGRDVIGCLPCEKQTWRNFFEIFSLADADRIRGCPTINSNLLISIRNKVNEDDLARSFSSLREISGYLEISSSDGLTSLKFLSGLKSIAAKQEILESGVYGLVLYDNENLKELWQPKGFKLVNGGMYVNSNQKLCNRKLHEFVRNVEHDRSKDLVHVNDQEVLCDPAKLKLDIEVLSHRSTKFSWPKVQTSNEVEIMYRPIGLNEKFVEHSELDSHICDRIKWTRILTFPIELHSNDTHYSYTAQDLKPNQRYACLVKTFGHAETYDARSELMYIITKPDLPGPPKFNLTEKTDVSFTITLENSGEDVVRYFIVELYEHPDNEALLDKRDFCTQPGYAYTEGEKIITDVDHDTCCTQVEEEIDNERFIKNVNSLFKCSLDHLENCNPDITMTESSHGMKPKRRLHVNPEYGKTTIISNLERYRLYSVQVQSCNEVGCGNYNYYWIRTDYAIGGNALDTLQACRVADLNEFHVYFKEPPHPNGIIIAYVVHFREVLPDAANYKSHIECVTRKQHMYNGYRLIAQLDAPFNEVAVRVYSLAGGFITSYVPVSICTEDQVRGKFQSPPKRELFTYLILLILVLVITSIILMMSSECFKCGFMRFITNFQRTLALMWAPRRRRNEDTGNPLVVFRQQAEDD